MAKSFLLVAVCFLSSVACTRIWAAPPPPAKKSAPTNQLETYKDLIQKAQNLTLQRDRLQASQILLRGLAREPKTSVAYKELTKALQELTTVFYTERAQSAFVAGEANLPLKPKEAIESFQEALRLEDGNVAVLNALARVHLTLNECDKADALVKTAESLDPYSPEVFLLRLQTWDCSKAYAFLDEKIHSSEAQLAGVEPYARGIQLRELIRKKEFKKAKALLEKWTLSAKDYPEVAYWTFELSRTSSTLDRSAGRRYIQLCQNLSPRKRKSYSLDVDLCKNKESVETLLKESSDED